MRVGSLFTGIGGFDLGLERAGFDIAWQVENDPYCVQVLERHWPDVPRYGDIREVDYDELERVDILAGGFPCQPVSVAGRQLGQDDERWLWPEFARAVRDLRPRYVLVENVPGLLVRGMGDVLGDLADLGYDTEWRRISAADMGAPHLRQRIWIVAYPNGDSAGCCVFAQLDSEPSSRRETGIKRNDPDGLRDTTSPQGRLSDTNRDELRHFGERHREQYSVEGTTVARDDGSHRTVADTTSERTSDEPQGPHTAALVSTEPRTSRRTQDGDPAPRTGVRGRDELDSPPLLADADAMARAPSSPCDRQSGPISFTPQPERLRSGGQSWTTESGMGRSAHGIPGWLDGTWEHGIPRTAHGIPDRPHRLKALGNAVIPQIPELLGRLILAHATRDDRPGRADPGEALAVMRLADWADLVKDMA